MTLAPNASVANDPKRALRYLGVYYASRSVPVLASDIALRPFSGSADGAGVIEFTSLLARQLIRGHDDSAKLLPRSVKA